MMEILKMEMDGSSCAITPVFLVSSYPPNGAIDARIPHQQYNSANTYGWNSINLTFQDMLMELFQVIFLLPLSGVLHL